MKNSADLGPNCLVPKVLRPFNSFKPREDECVISYIIDLASANAITYNDLINKYHCSGIMELYRKSKEILSDFGVNMSTDEIIEKLTVYPAVSGLISWEKQVRLTAMFQNSFAKYNYFLEPRGGTAMMLAEKKICPICAMEDEKKYGRYYYHRSHQIPGVNVCWKHHVSLINCNSETLFINYVPAEKLLEEHNECTLEVPAHEITYAMYARYVLLNGIQGNNKDISVVLYKSISSNCKNREEAIDAVRRHELGSKVDVNMNSFYGIMTQAAETDGARIYCPEILLSLLIIFCRGWLKNIDEWNRHYYETEDKNIPDEYDVIRKSTNLIYLEHSCGHAFCVPPEGFSKGFTCPCCDDASDGVAKFEQVVKKINPDFMLLTPFAGINKRVKVQHKCGLKSEPRARRLLYRFHCDCERYVTEKQVNDCLSNGELKLIDVKYGFPKNTLVTCECKKCGRVFTKNFVALAKHPHCPNCRYTKVSEKRAKDEAVFREEFAALVNENEYEIFSYGSGPNGLKLLHKKCNHITVMSGTDFLSGGRCDLCGMPYKEEFSKYIKKISGGRYEILPEARNFKFSVKDVLSGRIIENIDKKTIIQEISRPTQSDVFPLDLDVRKKKSGIKFKSLAESILALINSRPFKDYSLREIYESYGTGKNTSSAKKIKMLCRQGMIAQVGDGLYHSIDDQKLDKRRIVHETQNEIKNNIMDSMLYEKRFTAELVSGVTCYPHDKVITALISLVHEGKIVKCGDDEFAIAAALNASDKMSTERVGEYIDENFSDRPFRVADIKIPGINKSVLTQFLLRLQKAGKLKKYTDGLYSKPDVAFRVEDYIITPTAYIRYLINLDITKDYKIEDFVCERFSQNNIKFAFYNLLSNKEVYRIGVGIYHSVHDKNLDLSRVMRIKSSSGRSVLTNEHAKIVKILKEYKILSFKKIYAMCDTDIDKNRFREMLRTLEKNDYIYKAGFGVYGYGHGKRCNDHIGRNMVFKAIKECSSEKRSFSIQDIINKVPAYTDDEVTGIFNEIKRRSGQIKTVSDGKYVLKITPEEKTSDNTEILFNIIKGSYTDEMLFTIKDLRDQVRKANPAMTKDILEYNLRKLVDIGLVTHVKTGFYKICQRDDAALKKYIREKMLPSDTVYEYLEMHYMKGEVFKVNEVIKALEKKLSEKEVRNAIKKLVRLKKVIRVSNFKCQLTSLEEGE